MRILGAVVLALASFIGAANAAGVSLSPEEQTKLEGVWKGIDVDYCRAIAAATTVTPVLDTEALLSLPAAKSFVSRGCFPKTLVIQSAEMLGAMLYAEEAGRAARAAEALRGRASSALSDSVASGPKGHTAIAHNSRPQLARMFRAASLLALAAVVRADVPADAVPVLPNFGAPPTAWRSGVSARRALRSAARAVPCPRAAPRPPAPLWRTRVRAG
jgi:hypothetical protein